MKQEKQYWFSSDFHLGHNNILRFDNRPFNTIEEHDTAIIKNCQEVFKEGDDFYYLGDFSFNRNKTEGYLQQLSCGQNMFFIKGNHDKDTIKLYEKYGTYLGGLSEIYVNGQSITLCHYRMDVWNKSHHNAWHLYGHTHHNLADNLDKNSMDVGINGKDYNYTPVNFEDVKRFMSTKNESAKNNKYSKERGT